MLNMLHSCAAAKRSEDNVKDELHAHRCEHYEGVQHACTSAVTLGFSMYALRQGTY